MSKRKAFVALAAVFTLAACGNGQIPAQPTQSVQTTQSTTSVQEAQTYAASAETAPADTSKADEAQPTTGLTESAEPEKSTPLDRYIFRCTDDKGTAVSGVKIQVCTEEMCVVIVSGDDGIAEYAEVPYAYDVHILRYPEGYSLTSEKQFISVEEYTEYDITFTAN